MSRRERFWVGLTMAILIVATTIALTRQQNVINQLEDARHDLDVLVAANTKIIDETCAALETARDVVVQVMSDLRDSTATTPDIDAELTEQIDRISTADLNCRQ